MWRDPGLPTDSYYQVRPECTDVPKTKFKIKVCLSSFFLFINTTHYLNFDYGLTISICLVIIIMIGIWGGLVDPALA